MVKIDDPALTELRAERHAWAGEIRAVITALDETRRTFKSKQIERARHRLLALLAPIPDSDPGR